VFGKPISRQFHQRLTLIRRKKAAANHVANPNRSGHLRQAGFRLLNESKYYRNVSGGTRPKDECFRFIVWSKQVEAFGNLRAATQ
jgi:hypothetical protein